MITWKKIEAGEYESTDRRFKIFKKYSVTFGNCWALDDGKAKHYCDARYYEYSLKDAKARAEGIVKREIGEVKTP